MNWHSFFVTLVSATSVLCLLVGVAALDTREVKLGLVLILLFLILFATAIGLATA